MVTAPVYLLCGHVFLPLAELLLVHAFGSIAATTVLQIISNGWKEVEEPQRLHCTCGSTPL